MTQQAIADEAGIARRTVADVVAGKQGNAKKPPNPKPEVIRISRDPSRAAQERGEVSKGGGRPDCVEDRNAVPATAADLGLRRDEIHDARKLRDAEAAGTSRWQEVSERFRRRLALDV